MIASVLLTLSCKSSSSVIGLYQIEFSPLNTKETSSCFFKEGGNIKWLVILLGLKHNPFLEPQDSF